MPEPWNVFYSYSHADAQLRQELMKFLAPLKHQGRIKEWYDRIIEPGSRWESAISDELSSADLILLLVSADFLASDYCFGVEMEMAMRRMKNRDAKVLPILLKPCLWRESRFSELQLLPRDAKPVTSSASREDALAEIAAEIGLITKEPPLTSRKSAPEEPAPAAATDFSLVREQMVAYARLYERIRQKMPASGARTAKMDEVFQQMKALATAAFPLLSELACSHSPGEKLAAVAILECISSPKYLGYLVELLRSEKPFIGYHAARALEFAVSATEPRYYPQLRQAIEDAIAGMEIAAPSPGSDRKAILSRARLNLEEALEF